jgi:hypothetical protein
VDWLGWRWTGVAADVAEVGYTFDIDEWRVRYIFLSWDVFSKVEAIRIFGWDYLGAFVAETVAHDETRLIELRKTIKRCAA